MIVVMRHSHDSSPDNTNVRAVLRHFILLYYSLTIRLLPVISAG